MHEFRTRVYYEDTDLAGLVYYANYLRFIERARTEMLRSRDISQVRLRAETGIVIVVREISAKYHSPARFDDELLVQTCLASRRKASFTLRQVIRREDTRLFSASVQLVCIDGSGRPRRIPARVTGALDQE